MLTKIGHWWYSCFIMTSTRHLNWPYWDKTVFENASTSLSLVMGNWQTPGCAQRDCDFTSHSRSNILLLWIKSSQSKSVSACACLFGKEMLFRSILFVIAVEPYDIQGAYCRYSAISEGRALGSLWFSFWSDRGSEGRWADSPVDVGVSTVFYTCV